MLVVRCGQQEQYRGSGVMTDGAHLEFVVHHQHTRLSGPLFTPSYEVSISTTQQFKFNNLFVFAMLVTIKR